MVSTHGYVDPVPQLGRTDTGGQVVYVLELAKALSQCGVQVDVYTRWFESEKKPVEPVPDAQAVRLVRIRGGPWKFVPKEEIYELLPELVENLICFVRGNGLQYDLLHGHYVDGGIVAAAAAQALGRPAFFTPHSLGAWKREEMGGDSEEMERRYHFRQRIDEEVRLFQTVSGITVTTELQMEKLTSLYGVTPDPISLIPPGVDLKRFRPLEPGEGRTPLPVPEPYIFCLSRIDTNKGHDLLLYAFALVAEQVPQVHLVIGGGSQDPLPRERDVLAAVRTTAEANGLQNRVHLIGYVPDHLLVPFYRQATLFAIPSVYEPFGMTGLEAMACGTPVVASRFGGIREVITSDRNGVLVDPASPQEFAEGMVGLLRDPRLAERMGQEGRKAIQESYSWQVMAERHLAFYQNVL